MPHGSLQAPQSIGVSDFGEDAGRSIETALQKQKQPAMQTQTQRPRANHRSNSRTLRERTARDPEGCSCELQHPVPRCSRKSWSREMTTHTPEAKLLVLKYTSLQPKTARCEKRWPGTERTLVKHQVLETFRGKKLLRRKPRPGAWASLDAGPISPARLPAKDDRA